ncbi:unnamed protein product [Gongylonema pulchrum]|uniref:Histone acetyltransferase n=1 Tax=Gongylonema pulchrum TaxID=637853 RepID=A0A183DD45_9BILA|nr:unnamed protein product [Gongylonema pulchrum]
MQKALELTMSVPERAADMVYIRNIEQYPGDLNKLGRLYRHDAFMVREGDDEPVERYLFLFKNKIMFTEKDSRKEPPSYKHQATIRVSAKRFFTYDFLALIFTLNDYILQLLVFVRFLQLCNAKTHFVEGLSVCVCVCVCVCVSVCASVKSFHLEIHKSYMAENLVT